MTFWLNIDKIVDLIINATFKSQTFNSSNLLIALRFWKMPQHFVPHPLH